MTVTRTPHWHVRVKSHCQWHVTVSLMFTTGTLFAAELCIDALALW